jgi:hypothetical protein
MDQHSSPLSWLLQMWGMNVVDGSGDGRQKNIRAVRVLG